MRVVMKFGGDGVAGEDNSSPSPKALKLRSWFVRNTGFPVVAVGFDWSAGSRLVPMVSTGHRPRVRHCTPRARSFYKAVSYW